MQLEQFQNFLKTENPYKPDQITEVLQQVRKFFRFAPKNAKHKYFDVPCSFDIETSSFYDRGEKRVIMYCWTFNIYGLTIFGRTWEEFHNMLTTLCTTLDLNLDKRLIIYVHNLAHEFQFIMKHFEFNHVFAISNRKPIYALTESGIEFRCSYLLSGYKLEKLGDELKKYQVKKLVGDLDYSKMRHTETPMTESEVGYCVNDVRVVAAYIAECIEAEGGISRIPYTKTGYVRRYCKNACFYTPGVPKKKDVKRLRYRQFIKSLTLTADCYRSLIDAFQGGFTHANAFHVDKVMYDVSSYDFTSSYPAVMLSEKFPMSAPIPVDVEQLTNDEFIHLLKSYSCLFDVEFIGLKERDDVFENYISESRCWVKENVKVNNGRISAADSIKTTITEQDFFIIKQFYTWDGYRVSNMFKFYRDYLPKDFILAILKLYEDKTTLKGVEGKETEYLLSKGMLNSCYGMAVTNIVRPEYVFSDHWEEPTEPDIEQAIEDYNKAPGRFLYYPWGVWVTAYARRNLFTAIYEAGMDYVYSDTDSIKLINADDHKKYFDEYNEFIIEKLQKTLQHYKIDIERIAPKTIKGIAKPLGVWDFEGTYTKFKTLGAKRYLTEKDGNLEITVAGTGKHETIKYLNEKYPDVFDVFEDGLYIPKGCTGKLTHTYIDEEMRGVVTDYKGKIAEYHEWSGVHLENADYTLGIGQTFKDFLLEITGRYIES